MYRRTAVTLILSLALSLPLFANEVARDWVFFRGRDVSPTAFSAAHEQLTERAIHRRAKSMRDLTDEFDLPVNPEHVAQVAATGARIRVVSRYLNAVSVEANEEQLAAIRALACVSRVQPFHAQRTDRRLDLHRRRAALDDPVYGPSLLQNQMCRVPELHTRGLNGSGILICFLDTGFRLSHVALASLNVAATHDFIFNDENVGYDPAQDSLDQDAHGTAVLSTAAGYRDSLLIGPAYAADVMLAKTEWVHDETPVEEDYFVAALEWADSMGADIVSASLGYFDWYTFADMDGQTAVTTIGVTIAARHGILCVLAAGNERHSPWGHIIAPADADSILAVGAVDTSGIIAGFSSPGPTADGRIKPDVCALGVDVFCASTDIANPYGFAGGTSLATPLVSGVAACVWQAHPDWSAQQVRTALMQTASRASMPNNDYGWGIVDGVAAADFVFESSPPGRRARSPDVITLGCFPNPVNGIATLTLSLAQTVNGCLVMYDLLGRQVKEWPSQDWPAGTHRIPFDVRSLPGGVYSVRLESAPVSPVARMIVVK